ncbi:MAG: hypothetical protein PUI89_07425 [Bacteroidales bacterium]|nr:hypothetical protein [Bacteroidales bacterium]
MSRNTLYITLLALLCSTLLSVSCQRMNGGAVPDDDPSRTTCLRFSMGGIELPNTSLREQGDNPSIQSDSKDYEDYVGELAVLIYKVGATDAQSLLVKSHFTTEQYFLMELQPEEGARYHFCFVANYPESWKNTLEGLKTYADLKKTLQHLESFQSRNTGTPLYNGAVMNGTEKSLFPMARIYENQIIPAGGSVSVPKPFTPTTNTSKPLEPVSNWPDSPETGTTQQTVNLVRSSAKVSLNLTGDGVSKIKSIKICNVATQHSFMENSESASVALTDKPFNGSGSITGNSFQAKMYIPERLLGEGSATLGWEPNSDMPIGTPSYIQIEMVSGVVHKIPIISNQNTQNMTPGAEYTYLDVAYGKRPDNHANYSIVRNHHYRYDINVPADGKYLVINFKVMPWQLIQSELQFTLPKYTCTLKVLDATTNATKRTLDDISQEVLLSHNEIVEVTFQITKPVGAIWSASITNGLNYLFTGKTYDQVEPDIVGGVPPQTYTFQIKPRQEFTSEPYYTQFYIVVDGKELDLDPKRSRDSYMDGGGSKRWRIKQVMY